MLVTWELSELPIAGEPFEVIGRLFHDSGEPVAADSPLVVTVPIRIGVERIPLSVRGGRFAFSFRADEGSTIAITTEGPDFTSQTLVIEPQKKPIEGAG